MNERKRQAYLEAMDIQTYFPRQQLPGAKPSPLYDFPIEQSPVLVDLAEDSPSVLSREGTRPDGLHALEELRSSGTAVRKATVTPIKKPDASSDSENGVQPENAVQQEPRLSFTLRYYRINEKLAVLDEMPGQASRELSERSTSLLQAILRALGQAENTTNLKVEEFSWPMRSGYPLKDTPQAEAAKAISGFLQMRKETDGFGNLLVFAGQLEEVLLQFEGSNNARDFESSRGYFITVTHSLASMLAVPTLKRDVWEQLQAIRKRIS